jgi:hypothetical protein
MNRNSTRADLKKEIFTALGAPLIKVNLTDEQMDYIINYSIKKYWRWHYEGSFETYYYVDVTQADVDAGYLTVPQHFDSVTQIIPTNSLSSQLNWATTQWQMTASNILAQNRFMPLSLVDYVATQQLVTNTRVIMGEDYKLFEFVKHQRRVNPHFRWAAGDRLVLKVFEVIDPDRTDPAAVNSSLLFDDDVLRDLCVAKAKQQWGSILERFSGAVLPGGVTISGSRLIEEGKAEEEAWQQLVRDQTVDFMVVG